MTLKILEQNGKDFECDWYYVSGISWQILVAHIQHK